MQHSPRAGLTREWLQTANEDLTLAELATRANPPLLAGAVYHCQQAFEKALKAFLVWNSTPFRQTHDLSELVRLCEQIDPDFSRLAADAGLVTPYATQFRYPPVPIPATQSETTDALRAARDALDFTLQRLPPATHP